MGVSFKPVFETYAKMPLLVGGLLRRDMSEEAVAKLIGGNFLRALQRSPQRRPMNATDALTCRPPWSHESRPIRAFDTSPNGLGLLARRRHDRMGPSAGSLPSALSVGGHSWRPHRGAELSRHGPRRFADQVTGVAA